MAEKFQNESINFETQDNTSGDILKPQDKLQKELLDIKKNIFSIEWNEKLGNKKDSELLFNEYIDKFINEEKQNFINVIKAADGLDLEDYIYENGLPINKETFEFFENKFGKIRVDTTGKESNATEKVSNATEKESNATENESNATEKVSNEKEKAYNEKEKASNEKEKAYNEKEKESNATEKVSNATEKVSNEKEKAYNEKEKLKKETEKFKSIFSGKDSLVSLDTDLNNIVENIKSGINLKTNIKKFNESLDNNQELLSKLLSVLHDKNDGSYEKFTTYLREQPKFNFDSKIEQFEKVNNINPIKDSINSALVSNSTKYKDKYVSDLGGHLGLITDTSKRPPESMITNGKYKLKAELGVGNMYEPTLRYEMDIKNINKKIDGVNSKINNIDDKLTKLNNIDLSSEKGEDKLHELFIGNIQITTLIETYNFPLKQDKINELKGKINNILQFNYNNLKEEYNDLKNEFDVRGKQYHTELDNLKKKYFDNVGTTQKDIINFLNTIGLDTVPQSIIQPILNMISSGNPVHIGYETITGIDLENFTFEGSFTPSLGDGGVDDLNSKKVFMKLSNKMLTGDETFPIDVDSYTIGSKPNFRWKKDGEEDKYEQISDIDLQNRLKGNLGSMPDSVIKQNLGWIKK